MEQIILKKCTLPKTSIKHYLTAITALNIISEEGTGDWHFIENFLEDENFIPKKTVAGIDTLSTNKFFGNKGIFKCYKILVKSGLQPSTKEVYAADHYRAVADMIVNNVRQGYDIEKTIILDDWLPEPHEKEKLYSLIHKFKSVSTKKEWEAIKAWKMIN